MRLHNQSIVAEGKKERNVTLAFRSNLTLMRRGKQSTDATIQISFQRATETDERDDSFFSRTSENSPDRQSFCKSPFVQHQRPQRDSCSGIITAFFPFYFFTFVEFCCSSVSCSVDDAGIVLPPDSLAATA